MGNSHSAAELMRKLQAAGEAIAQADTKVVQRIAGKVKDSTIAERNRAVGSDGRMSHVGKRGASLNVRYDMRPGSPRSALVKANGPWHLIENPTRSHLVTSRYTKGAGTRARRSRGGLAGPVRPGSFRGGRRAVILTPWGYRRYARHPGTRGKKPWRVGVERGLSNTSREVATPIRDVLGAVFR